VPAVELYRAALAITESNKADVRTDPLQRLHALHNLAETLDSISRKHAAAQAAAAASGGGGSAAPAVARTLRDGTLWSEAAGLRDGYLAARIADLTAQRAAYNKAKSAAAGGKKGKQLQQLQGKKGARGVAAFTQALALPGVDGAGGSGVDHEDEEQGLDGEQAGSAVAAAALDGWYVAAIDALEGVDRGDEVVEAVKTALQASEQYNRAGAQNATSMARR